METLLYWGAVDETLVPLLHALRVDGREVVVAAPSRARLPRWVSSLTVALLDLRESDWPRVASDLAQFQVHWIGWNRDDLPTAGLQAYQAGASAVFPGHLPAEVLLTGLERLAERGRTLVRAPLEKTYPRGSLVLPDEHTVVEVIDGVLAQRAMHPDGAIVLLGLSGPGQLVVSHPHDSCSLQMEAHTDVRLLIRSWDQAERTARFGERLRARIQQLEAWAAMQARPHLDQRLLGLLSLLAEIFGRPHPQGTLIDLRLTQNQLASAANATRSTVTRAIGQLRRRGLLTTVGRGDQERYCLTRSEPHHHHMTTPDYNEGLVRTTLER